MEENDVQLSTVEAVNEDKKKTNEGKKLEITARSRIFAIREINTVNQTFTCDIFLRFEWNDASFDLNQFKTEEEKLMYCHKICPFFFFKLVEQKEIVEEFRYLEESKTIQYRYRSLATFAEPFELKKFPFDEQDLCIIFTLKRPKDEVILHCEKGILNTKRNRDFILADWNLWNCLETKVEFSDPDDSNTKKIYPVAKQTFYVSRKYAFYVWNIFFIMFILVSSAGSTFAIDPSNVGDRLSVVITVILAAIAFKLVIVENIPKVPYNTFLDVYILFCFMILGLITLENALASRDSVASYDTWIGLIIAIVWIAFNILTLFYARVLIWTYKHKLLEKEANYKGTTEAHIRRRLFRRII